MEILFKYYGNIGIYMILKLNVFFINKLFLYKIWENIYFVLIVYKIFIGYMIILKFMFDEIIIWCMFFYFCKNEFLLSIYLVLEIFLKRMMKSYIY